MPVRLGNTDVQSLLRLVNFFGNADEVQSLIVQYSKAAETHEAASKAHLENEANAKAAIEEADSKLATIAAKEQDLLSKGTALAEMAKELAEHKNNLEAQSASLAKDQAHVDALFENASRQAGATVRASETQARAAGAKILTEAKAEADRLVAEATVKANDASKAKELWDKSNEVLNANWAEYNNRTEKMNETLAKFADFLKGV